MNFPDVTINDFANTQKPKFRPTKSPSIPVDLNSILVNEENGDKLLGTKNEKNKVKRVGEAVGAQVYNDYPIDVWYVISLHIDPEDIVRFALICKKTYEIVESPTFWFHRYKRHYRKDVVLPTRLQPDCMVRLGGLRACVVRALYLLYEPFILTLKVTERRDPNALVNRQCLDYWAVQDKGTDWNYYFRFTRRADFSTQRSNSHLTPLEQFRDIHYNPHQDMAILIVSEVKALIIISVRLFRKLFYFVYFQVKSNKYEKFPDIIKDLPYLCSVTQHLSQGFRNYKMKLSFTNNFRSIVKSIVHDPVLTYRTLHWWNEDFHVFT